MPDGLLDTIGRGGRVIRPQAGSPPPWLQNPPPAGGPVVCSSSLLQTILGIVCSSWKEYNFYTSVSHGGDIMSGTGLRATGHNGRFGSARHNGRDFDLSKAKHIDPKKADKNFYWTWNKIKGKAVTSEQFTACEQAYYERAFQTGLDEQNELHRSKRQYKRVREMKDWMKSYQHRPEERILQVGSMDYPVPSAVSQAIIMDYLQWELDWSKAHGKPYQILDIAMHWDETSLHGHERRVWQYRDDKGIWRVGQNKALEKAGIPLPDPTKPEGTHNNRKMVFDAMCREKLLDICYAHGVQVEREALPWPNGHVSKSEYIANREMVKEQARKALELDQRALELDQRESTLERREAALDARESRIGRLEKVQHIPNETPGGHRLPPKLDFER